MPPITIYTLIDFLKQLFQPDGFSCIQVKASSEGVTMLGSTQTGEDP